MGIFFWFLRYVGKTKILVKNIVICNFSGYKGEPSYVETFGIFYRYLQSKKILNISD